VRSKAFIMQKGEPETVVVVARHGERLDYILRDAGKNWVATAERPYDPPLSDHGHGQGATLGRHLHAELVRRRLPPISAIYTSPFLRCRQTAVSAYLGITEAAGESEPLPEKVRVEPGLAESINEQWYRSWSLPGSNGTWGFRLNGFKTYDPDTLHPLAKRPVQPLLENWKNDETVDTSYQPKTAITEPYCFHPTHLETRQDQRRRMVQTLEAVSETGKTVMVVSHGGPVTHLYEELTGNHWTKHGESTYCCYSIYKKKKEEDQDGRQWEPVTVNRSNYLHEKLTPERHVSNV
jgi:broad specificity phosphatase PhoE